MSRMLLEFPRYAEKRRQLNDVELVTPFSLTALVAQRDKQISQYDDLLVYKSIQAELGQSDFLVSLMLGKRAPILDVGQLGMALDVESSLPIVEMVGKQLYYFVDAFMSPVKPEQILEVIASIAGLPEECREKVRIEIAPKHPCHLVVPVLKALEHPEEHCLQITHEEQMLSFCDRVELIRLLMVDLRVIVKTHFHESHPWLLPLLDRVRLTDRAYGLRDECRILDFNRSDLHARLRYYVRNLQDRGEEFSKTGEARYFLDTPLAKKAHSKGAKLAAARALDLQLEGFAITGGESGVPEFDELTEEHEAVRNGELKSIFDALKNQFKAGATYSHS